MKKLLCFILSFLLLSSMIGCRKQSHDTRYTFYYPRIDYGYNTQEGKFHDSIVEPELRKDITDPSPAKVLNIYLDGPIDQALTNPFPHNLSIDTINIDGQTLYIVVTDHLSELTGINLMIACACLGRTGIEMTDTASVQISCQTGLLEGKKSITFNRDSVIFDDMAGATTDKQE